MARLRGNGPNTGANLLLVLLVLIALFLIAYYAYLKPNGLLDLGFM